MKGARIGYSQAELFRIDDNATRPRREGHSEFRYLRPRPGVSRTNHNAPCKRRGWQTVRTAQYGKGRTPGNKGEPGWHAPGNVKGWFRKGERLGVAKRLHKPIGTERVSKDCYVARKIDDGLLPQFRWRAVHLIRWEEMNGALPEGQCLKGLDVEKSKTEAPNLRASPRALLPRLAGRWRASPYDTGPAELKSILLAAAQLDRALREARQKEARLCQTQTQTPTPSPPTTAIRRHGCTRS